MSNSRRITLRIAGESGQGINVGGEILLKALKRNGHRVFGYREYPSLIQGGVACYQIEVSKSEVRSPSSHFDLLVCLSRNSIHEYLPLLSPNSTLLHCIEKVFFSEEETGLITERGLHIQYIPAFGMALEAGENKLLANIVFAGVIWKLMGLRIDLLEEVIQIEFEDKPKLLQADLKAVRMGFDLHLPGTPTLEIDWQGEDSWKSSLVMTGNHALALGAVASGVRAYFGYPMTPSSSILSYISEYAQHTGMVVKQAEDEITAAQMTLGAMFAGTRALVGTSGGGFDLMTETLSLAGITEIPFVCILAQRPGPATGLPTWTSAGDLELALYSGHGEFPRCVIAASDPLSAFDLIQKALNISEEYQLPVILLTDKQIAESYFNFGELPKPIDIERGLFSEEEVEMLNDKSRYAVTAEGVSPRWLPGVSDRTYNSNSDEHDADGNVIEGALPAKEMMDKRQRKLSKLSQGLPEPEYFGDKDASRVLVGWGSVKNTVLDVLDDAEGYAYLHFEYIFPLKTATIEQLINEGKKFVLIENNQRGQLGKLLRQSTDVKFEHELLKYDGRPFFTDELKQKLNEL